MICVLWYAVLTAAHCVWNMRGATHGVVKVLLGAYTLRADLSAIAVGIHPPPPGALLLQAVDVIYPGDFRALWRHYQTIFGLGGHDFALVKLAQSVPMFAEIGEPPLK